MTRTAYASDISDEEWALVAPYVTLMTTKAPQRVHRLRDVLHGLRWVVRTGSPWRLMPHDLPPWDTLSQQTQRWIKARVFATLVHDLRAVRRVAAGRAPEPSAVILDSRTLQSTPASGTRAGDDGAKRRRGSKAHKAVDTLGYPLAIHITSAAQQDRAQVAHLAAQGQAVTGDAVEIASVDQGSTGAQAAQDAAAHHSQLEVVKLPDAKKGFVLMPKRWVVERRNAWAARFRRLARDYEQLAETLKGMHVVAFALLMLHRVVTLIL